MLMEYTTLSTKEIKRLSRFYDLDVLDEEDINLLFQPDWAPESFHQDGEVTPDEADRLWVVHLKARKIYHKAWVIYMLGYVPVSSSQEKWVFLN